METPNLLPTPEYLKTLGVCAAQCQTLLRTRSKSVRIPANIQGYMRGIAALDRYWQNNTAVHSVLLGAAKTSPAATGGGTSRRKAATA